MEKTPVLNEIRESALQLENIRFKLEQVSGVTKLCASTFEHKEAFSYVTEEETANALLGIHSQLEEIEKSMNSLLSTMYSVGKKTSGNESAELADSPKLEKFIISLDSAREFKEKHDKSGGLSFEQLTHLCQTDTYEALTNAYNIAFRRGYKTGKQAKKDTKKSAKA